MGLALTVARRSLLSRPGRTLFSLLGIALGIATVVGVFTLDHNTVEGLKLRFVSDWSADLEVSAHADVPDPRAELNQVPGVAASTAFFQQEAVLRRADAEPAARGGRGGRGQGGPELRAPVLAVEAATLGRLDAYEILSGRAIDPDAAGIELLVGERVATELGLSAGDALLLSRPVRSARRACIDGVMQEVDGAVRDVPVQHAATVVGILARRKLGDRAQGGIVLADYGKIRDVYRGARVDERFWVRRNPAVDLERLQADLSRSFAYDIGRSVIVGEAADERAFRNGVRMAGLLALVLGLYIIFHTLSTSLVERVREVGTLHALGTTRGQIARIFLVEATALAGAGGLLGLLGGIGLAQLLLSKGISTLGSGRNIPFVEVPWEIAGSLTLLGVGVALLGSIYPLLRVRGASSVEALRGEQALVAARGARGFHLFTAILLAGLLPGLYFVVTPVVGEATGALVGSMLVAVGVLALLVAVPLVVPALLAGLCRAIALPLRALWPFSGAMAARTMLDNPRRIAISTAALALVASAYVGLQGMTASLRGEVEVWADAAVQDKLYVLDLPPVSYAALRSRLRAEPGVLGVEAGSARVYSPFLILGLDVDEMTGHGPLAETPRLRAALRRADGMILSERLARNLGYQVGDAVQVRIGSGKVVPFEVVAISDAYGFFPHPDERMYGVISAHHMEHYFCLDTDRADRLAIKMAPGADWEPVADALHDFLGGESPVRFRTGEELGRFAAADIADDFVLFDIVLGLTALLAALGVLNGMLLSALERSKELGVLRALGTARLQIAGMVLIEAAVVGLVGALVGLLLGSALGPVVVRSLESLSGLDLPLRVLGPWLPTALVGTLALTLLAALYPIHRMNRMDPVRAVRTG